MIDVVIEDNRWSEHVAEMATRVEAAVLARHGLSPDEWETSILLANDAAMRELNREFRNKDKATDVLSWPAHDVACEEGEVPAALSSAGGPFGDSLGDMALGYETCLADAAKGSVDFDNHITHLILHGFLHLLGYDHIQDSDAVIMETLEVEILSEFDIDNPYKRNT